jgi:glycosyltransferase involved in cell wall biosynthesis
MYVGSKVNITTEAPDHRSGAGARLIAPVRTSSFFIEGGRGRARTDLCDPLHLGVQVSWSTTSHPVADGQARGSTAVYCGIDSHNVEREGEGNSTYGRGLISALVAAGGDARFALFAGNPEHPFYRALSSRSRPRVIRVAQASGVARLGWALGRAASRERVDVLHTQYGAPLGYRGPLVVTVHDLGFLHVPESFPLVLRLGLRLLVPRSMARAARIITASEFARRDILARYPVYPEKVVPVPLGVDPRFRPLGPMESAPVLARHGLEPGFLFSLGRLNRRKNLERLLLAYARARSSGVADTPLVIGGKPDHGVDEVLRRAKRSGDVSAVRFVGLIPDADLPAFYSAAGCFVYPSLFEGFGLPLLEAMACGTPVVTSDRTALPELVGDAGLLIDPESVDALAAAIARVLGDGALARELGARGLERSRRYSWGETARRTFAVYQDAVSTTGAGPPQRSR